MIRKVAISAAVVLLGLASLTIAAPGKFPTFTSAADAGPDFATQGEYRGSWSTGGETEDAGAQVVALGESKFRVVLYHDGLPGAGWDRTMKSESYNAETIEGVITFSGDNIAGTLREGLLKLADSGGQPTGELKKIERQSPTLGAAPPEGAVVLFDGKSQDNFSGGGRLIEGLLMMGPAEDGTGRGEAVSKQSFGSFTLHAEFRTPFIPTAAGQARGNSGVYLQNRYECQVLDSFGLSGEDNECGGFYKFRKPDVNMCFPPLAWQTYDIDFTAPQFDSAGAKLKNARVTVRHNGVVIHDDFELPQQTPGGLKDEGPTGPLKLQDHGNPVAFRNIWIVPLN
jgi:3-keto-disaccharide hydrolase